MKWISVEDKLPKSASENVLTCSVTGKGEFFGIFVLYYTKGDWWRSMDGIWPFQVTHWMPLPEPPISLIDKEEKIEVDVDKKTALIKVIQYGVDGEEISIGLVTPKTKSAGVALENALKDAK